MTSINTGGTLTQQLYMRLFDRLNTDGDDALSIDEVGASSGQKFDSGKIFKTLDADGDGRVIRSEMTPAATFGHDTLASLIDAQADQSASDPASSTTEILAALFDRADLDGDGALNAEEMKAESDLRKAANLDAGYSSGPIFKAVDNNDDGLLTKDEFSVGQQIRSLNIPDSAIRFYDELPAEQQQQMQAMRERAGLPPITLLTDEEKMAKRAQWAADRAERASGPEGTTTFLSREISGLRDKASAAFADEKQGSDSISHRLLQQILSEAWKTEASA